MTHRTAIKFHFHKIRIKNCLGYFDPKYPWTIFLCLDMLYQKNGKRKGIDNMIDMIIETIVHESVHSWIYNNVSDRACTMYDNIAPTLERWYRRCTK